MLQRTHEDIVYSGTEYTFLSCVHITRMWTASWFSWRILNESYTTCRQITRLPELNAIYIFKIGIFLKLKSQILRMAGTHIFL